MIMLIKTLAAVAAGTVLATNAFAQSTREIRDVSPYVAIENESPPKLIVDPTPLAAGLAHDIVWIQYHAENVRIVPVFGAGAAAILRLIAWRKLSDIFGFPFTRHSRCRAIDRRGLDRCPLHACNFGFG